MRWGAAGKERYCVCETYMCGRGCVETHTDAKKLWRQGDRGAWLGGLPPWSQICTARAQHAAWTTSNFVPSFGGKSFEAAPAFSCREAASEGVARPAQSSHPPPLLPGSPHLCCGRDHASSLCAATHHSQEGPSTTRTSTTSASVSPCPAWRMPHPWRRRSPPGGWRSRTAMPHASAWRWRSSTAWGPRNWQRSLSSTTTSRTGAS